MGGLTAVNGVDDGDDDEGGEIGAAVLDPIQAQAHGAEDCHAILPTVHQVRKDVLSVVVATETLQGTPDGWEGGEETE